MSNPIEQSWEIHKVYSKHKYFWYFISKIKTRFIMHVLHKADLVLPTTKWMVDDFAKKGIERSKMMPFPNGIDTNRFSSANGVEIRKRYGLEDSKVIMYIGTMNKERHLDVLIHAFLRVRENKKNVKLLMVGDGTDKTNLERLAIDLGIKNDVIFTGQVYFDEIPNFIAAGDIGVAHVPPLDFYKLSSPIKMFEYLAMGKPVVANEEIPEQKEVMRESGGGVLVKFEAESFANEIMELLNNPERAKEMGERGREWVMGTRNYEILACLLEERYFKVLSRRV
jgi:glycosyltransferase involved in cell wall biosynthesis